MTTATRILCWTYIAVGFLAVNGIIVARMFWVFSAHWYLGWTMIGLAVGLLVIGGLIGYDKNPDRLPTRLKLVDLLRVAAVTAVVGFGTLLMSPLLW